MVQGQQNLLTITLKHNFFDLMGVIRSVRIFRTIKELVFKILNTILIGCYRIDVVADSYITVSWKT